MSMTPAALVLLGSGIVVAIMALGCDNSYLGTPKRTSLSDLVDARFGSMTIQDRASVREVNEQDARRILREYSELQPSNESPENVQPDTAIYFQSGSSPVVFEVERLQSGREVKVLYDGTAVLVGDISSEGAATIWGER